jgi:hypothetical protein
MTEARIRSTRTVHCRGRAWRRAAIAAVTDADIEAAGIHALRLGVASSRRFI